MATAAQSTNGQIRELTREEGLALLDREARRYVQMSAEAFIRAWEAGEFDDDPDRPDVMYVAMLLPFVQYALRRIAGRTSPDTVRHLLEVLQATDALYARCGVPHT